MDSPIGSPARRWPAENDASGERCLHRSASNLSSTSSDIQVAARPTSASEDQSLSTALPPIDAMTEYGFEAVVVDGRVLIVRAKTEKGRTFLRNLANEGRPNVYGIGLDHVHDSVTEVKQEFNEGDDDGPNSRGTYSKKYTLLHPEIAWVHRGQGRYLPVTKPTESTQTDQ